MDSTSPIYLPTSASPHKEVSSAASGPVTGQGQAGGGSATSAVQSGPSAAGAESQGKSSLGEVQIRERFAEEASRSSKAQLESLALNLADNLLQQATHTAARAITAESQKQAQIAEQQQSTVQPLSLEQLTDLAQDESIIQALIEAQSEGEEGISAEGKAVHKIYLQEETPTTMQQQQQQQQQQNIQQSKIPQMQPQQQPQQVIVAQHRPHQPAGSTQVQTQQVKVMQSQQQVTRMTSPGIVQPQQIRIAQPMQQQGQQVRMEQRQVHVQPAVQVQQPNIVQHQPVTMQVRLPTTQPVATTHVQQQQQVVRSQAAVQIQQVQPSRPIPVQHSTQNQPAVQVQQPVVQKAEVQPVRAAVSEQPIIPQDKQDAHQGPPQVDSSVKPVNNSSARVGPPVAKKPVVTSTDQPGSMSTRRPLVAPSTQVPKTEAVIAEGVSEAATAPTTKPRHHYEQTTIDNRTAVSMQLASCFWTDFYKDLTPEGMAKLSYFVFLCLGATFVSSATELPALWMVAGVYFVSNIMFYALNM